MLRQLYSPSTHFCHKYDCTYSTVRLYRSFWIQEAWDPAMDSSHRPRSAARSSAAEISSRPGSSACPNACQNETGRFLAGWPAGWRLAACKSED
jgi:hypothetical protein